METNVKKDYVIRKLKEYAAIPSLTHYEDEFMNHLIRDFGTPEGMEWITIYIEGQTQALFLRCVSDECGLVFTVHTDRISARDGKPFENTITESEEDGTISGQLDNIISIAVLRYIIESGIKINILFTTQEEVCTSYHQVASVADEYGLLPVSIDIDPIGEFEQGKDATITIREKSFTYVYEPETVRMLQVLANRNSIPFETQYGYVYDEILFLIRADKGTGGHLGFPLMDYHTNRERVKTSAIISMIDLISSVAQAEEFKRVNFKINNEIFIN